MDYWIGCADQLTSALGAVSPAEWCRTFFVVASGIVLGAAVMPDNARRLLLDYGPRRGAAATQEKQHADDAKKTTTTTTIRPTAESGNLILKLISYATSWGQVPHAWFATFYVTFLLCAAFWFAQYVGHGAVLRSIVLRQASVSEKSMTVGQVVVTWTLMCMQTGRRLLEHEFLFKASNSKMWFVHWLLGVFFYAAMSVSVWVEGSGAISTTSFGETTLGTPQLHTVVGILAFLFAWANQYWCHRQLAGLKKYSLPRDGMFRYFICPHYTCECLLYFSLAVVAAPEGSFCNQTLLCALLFVVANLGATSFGTRRWYIEKFGAENVTQRWNMIPFVF